jgi:hypothetical protein
MPTNAFFCQSTMNRASLTNLHHLAQAQAYWTPLWPGHLILGCLWLGLRVKATRRPWREE